MKAARRAVSSAAAAAMHSFRNAMVAAVAGTLHRSNPVDP
jgi:hypothetical protein